jgi:hypothetical protein
MAIQFSAPPTTPAVTNNTVSNPADTTQSNIAGYAQAETNDYSMVQYLVAWTIVLLLAIILNRTRWGHALIYYALVLALALLLVTNYAALTALLAPAGSESTGPGTADTGTDTIGPAQEASSPTLAAGSAAAGQIATVHAGGTTIQVLAGAPRFNTGG